MAAPDFIIQGEWTDPAPDPVSGQRSHPFGVDATCLSIDKIAVIFPDSRAAITHYGAAADAVAAYLASTTETVVQFPVRNGQSVVEVCTELLAKAHRGELTMMAVAMTYADGDLGHIVTAGEHFNKLLGGIEVMKFAMLSEHCR